MTIPICECGFDFAKAKLKRQRVESYAAIRDCDYARVMRRESAILSEHDHDKALALIADAAPLVGSFMRCPKCGTWLFIKPQHGTRHATMIFKPVLRAKSQRRAKGRTMANARRRTASKHGG